MLRQLLSAPEVLGAMTPYLTDNFYNPSASYLPAVKVAQDLDGARASIALILGAKQSEIIFTAGATEANNLAIQGVMNQFPGSNIITSSIEHESVLRPAEVYDRRELPVSADGIVDISKISQVVDDKTVLVMSCMPIMKLVACSRSVPCPGKFVVCAPKVRVG